MSRSFLELATPYQFAVDTHFRASCLQLGCDYFSRIACRSAQGVVEEFIAYFTRVWATPPGKDDLRVAGQLKSPDRGTLPGFSACFLGATPTIGVQGSVASGP